MTARNFSLQLSREWAETVDDIQEAVAGIALVALNGVVRKSPVDTGRFRANWIVSLGAVSPATLKTVDPSGNDSINLGFQVLSGYPEHLPVVYIQNNLPYATRLESGWSKQAPAGMVALTIAEIEAQFNGREI